MNDEVTEVTGDTTSSTDKSNSHETEQSSEGKESTTFRLPHVDRDLTAQEVVEEAKKMSTGFTKANQENKQLKQRLAEIERTLGESTTTGDAANRATKDLVERLKTTDPVAYDTLKAFAEAEILPKIREESQATQRAKAQQEYWDGAFKELASEWDGKDGKPKFDPTDKEAIYEAMNNSGNRNYDVKDLWEKSHKQEILDYYVAQGLKRQKGGLSTERTGMTGTKMPQEKNPTTWAESKKRMISRLTG
jgi:hypothetical protein